MTFLKKGRLKGKLFCFAIALFFTSITSLFAQDPFPDYAPVYKDNVVARVDIILPQDSLEVILAPGNEESDYHFHATFSFDNDSIQETIENVGFRLRGNTSRYSKKKSFKVSFNTYEPGRKWYGVEKLNLNGEHNDPTISRSKICWDLLRNIGVPAPRASHVQLYINDVYYGVYANIEHIDEEFAGTRFGNKDGNLYKCHWPADLNYIGSDPDLYKFKSGNRRAYELKTNEEEDDYSDLAYFIDVLNNTPTADLQCALESIFNINPFLMSMAFDVLSGNWDGPLYNKNNFYLYHNEATGLFEYIPYDLDNTFGIDWFSINWAERYIYAWAHTTEPRPLYWRILEVQEYRDRFSYYMSKIINKVYTEAALFSKIDDVKMLIEPYVTDDSFYPLDYGFSIQDFNNGFEQALPYFHTPAGLKPFITDRTNAALSQLQYNDIPPIISQIANNHPTPTEEIAIRAYSEDDQGIADLEACYQLDGEGNMVCVKMFDDGLHLDGEAGDNVYGTLIAPLGIASILEYFIQATDLNNNISQKPVCGTRQLFVGSSSVSLAINEFMASNDTTITDQFGEFEDWVEIYHFGDIPVYLGDKYLTDDPDKPTKWQFPDIWIQPGDFLLIWTDDDEEQGELHTSYKLSAGGEYIGIFDNDNALIDGLEFGPQETDQAFGRLPDGTGPFQILKATPGASNEALTTTREPDGLQIQYQIYPNPTRDILYLQFDRNLRQIQSVVLMNTFGQIILQKDWQSRLMFNIDHLQSGLYFLAFREDGNIETLGKIIKE